MHRIDLTEGGRTKALSHPSEAAYVVASGAAEAHQPNGDTLRLTAPSVLYIPPLTPYVLAADDATTIFGGPCPPDPGLYLAKYAAETPVGTPGRLKSFDPLTDGLPIPMISRQGRLVVWPGIGAKIATMVYVILEPGDENDPHEHKSSDDTIAILEGQGSVDNLTDGTTHEFSQGDVVFVRAGVRHKVKADRGSRIVAAGGPCPPDYQMLERLSD
jgi:quercetin dioxygenase-like cupin family protein